MLSRLRSGHNHTNTLLVDSSHPRIRFAELWKLLGRRIQFHPIFVGMTGSVTASLMLSQGFYWTRNWLLEHPHTEGWFWKKQQDWQAETGLSRKEQETARRILRTLGFIQERREGMPARLSFRLDLDQIAQAVHPDKSGQMNWQDDAAVFELLGQPIVFHRSLVDITGSATASLMLSHSVVQTVRILNKRPDGWFYKSRDQWKQETGLSRWEQETARKVLKELGILEEKRALEIRADHDAAHVMYYRVNLKRLEEMLSKPETGLESSAEAERWEPGKQDCEKPAISKVGTGQTGLLITSNQQGGNRANSKVAFGQTVRWEPGNLKGGNRANMPARKPPYSLPENLPPYKEAEITSEITTPLPLQPTVAEEPGSGRGGEALIFPKQLDASLHEPFRQRLMAECPNDAQAVLDVMANAFQGKGVRSPGGLLSNLIDQVKRKTFDPLPGVLIAKRREQQMQLRAELDAMGQQVDAEQKAWVENHVAIAKAPEPVRQESQVREVARLEDKPVSAHVLQSLGPSAILAACRAKQMELPKITAPTVANSPTDAREASPLVQHKPLSRKPSTPLLSSGSRLVLMGGKQ